MQLRVRALETVLAEKGYIDQAALDAIVEAYETKVGPHTGARVVAKAWSDPAFKQALLADASKAVASFGLLNRVGDHLLAVENTPKQHNMIVCTLCSCYPVSLLGPSPGWYKSFAYRSRTVREPEAVLAEFGVTLPEDIRISVWDSTSEARYMVLPSRPAGTEALGAAELAGLVQQTSPRALITDAGLAQLAKLTRLWSLDLSETKVTDAGLQQLAPLVEALEQPGPVREGGNAGVPRRKGRGSGRIRYIRSFAKKGIRGDHTAACPRPPFRGGDSFFS